MKTENQIKQEVEQRLREIAPSSVSPSESIASMRGSRSGTGGTIDCQET